MLTILTRNCFSADTDVLSDGIPRMTGQMFEALVTMGFDISDTDFTVVEERDGMVIPKKRKRVDA